MASAATMEISAALAAAVAGGAQPKMAPTMPGAGLSDMVTILPTGSAMLSKVAGLCAIREATINRVAFLFVV